MFIDTHCHLDFPEFDQDRDEVIKRAKNGAVDYLINVGSSLGGCRRAIELSKAYEYIYATVGIHPHEADRFAKAEEPVLIELAKEKKVVAIGEIGLDYYLPARPAGGSVGRQGKNYSKVDGSTSLTIDPEWNRRVENQKLLFISLVKLARDLNLPLIIHNRQAQDDTLKILKEALPLKIVVHCFSGDEDFLKKCLSLGFFVSFTCNITYNKAKNLRALVKLTPLDRLMLETDAPYLPPQGLRGRRNEPLYVKYLAQEISKIKEISLEEVARVTTDNAKLFFNIK